MALQITHNQFGFDFTEAYVKITNVNITYNNGGAGPAGPPDIVGAVGYTININYNTWVNVAAKEANAQVLTSGQLSPAFDGTVSGDDIASAAYTILKTQDGFTEATDV